MSDYDPRPLPFYGPLLPGGDLSNLRNNEKMSSLPGPITQMDGAIEATEPTSSAAIPLPAPDSMAYNLSHVGFFNENNDENGHRYVGLVNQAMTCYLNSLIQTLYMTPEFRNAIYKWKFNGNSNEESKSIPFQLQKLFLLLQTSDKHSLETKELTNSFGWESTEAYDQHDVQELCRLMFDALEKKWRNSENKSLIQDLYKGSMQDYVKCTNCKTEKIREDSFLDLPLAVKPFGANEAYKSIEEALKAFVDPEILNGANQYECEKCKSKQDAEKGLRITKFPYNLAIQLKRFDFDYNTLHRIKLNDRMTFPDILNLNNFINDTSTCKPSTSKESPKISYASIAAKKSPPPQTIKEDEELDLGKAETMWVNEPVDSEVVKNLLAKGEYVYELFSVMVHQGSASGGHYYAYIKNMDKNSWFCFNDSLVQRATIEEIQKTFGGSSGGWSNSNTNAYMLMYRKIDPPKNAHFIRTSELPLHLVELKEKWIREEEEKDLQQRRQESLVKVNLTCNHERTLMDHPISLMIPRETSMADVVAQALDQFEHLKLLPENCRLIECSSSFDKLNEAIEDLEKKILDDYAPTYYSYLVRPEVYFMIDTKPTHEQPWFEVSKQNSYRQVDLFLVDLETEEIRPIKKLVFHENKTVGEFKQLICSLIPSLAEPASNFLHCRLVVDDEMDENASLSILDLPDISFGKCIKRAYMVAKIYVDGGCRDILEEDRKIEDAKETKFMKMLERKKFSMRIKIVLPTDTEYRQACMIPPTEREEVAKAQDNLQRSHSSLTMVSLPETSLQLTPNTKILNLSSSQPKSSALEHFPLMEGNSHGLSSMSVCNLSPHYETGYPDMCSTSDWQKNSAEQGSSGRNSPLSAAFDDDEGMDMSSIGTSPKRSPVVSDAGELSDNDNAFMSVTEQLHSEVNSRLMAIERMRSSRDQEFETETQTDSACETLIGGTETTSESVASIPYTTSIVSVDENGENKCLEVEADRRSLVVHFKTWIAQYLNLDSANFILVKHYNETDDGYESTVINETETLREYAQTINHLGIKLVGFQLASHEKLIRVCEYDVHNDDQEQWAPLFLLPASKSTPVQEFLEKCQAYLKNVYKSEYRLEQLRLRDLSEHGAVVMQLTDTLEVRGQQWSKNLYLQKIPEEQLSFSRGDPVIVRQWYPSKLEVGKVFEVFLPPGTSNVTKELRRILAQRTGLPFERIELSDAFPDKCWTKWPYSKGILELAEKVRFSTEILSPETGFVGKLVYFKDKNEFTKNISDDEKRAIRIKEQSVNVTRSTWRRERPLRIQMSSVSEDN